MDGITLVYLLLVILVWFFWIRKATRLFQTWRGVRSFNKATTFASQKLDSVSINFKYFPVRLSNDIPEFEGIMTINEVGECTIPGAIIKMNNIEMFAWNKRNNSNGIAAIEIQIAGKFFIVQEGSFRRAEKFLSTHLVHLKDRKHSDE